MTLWDLGIKKKKKDISEKTGEVQVKSRISSKITNLLNNVSSVGIFALKYILRLCNINMEDEW